MGRTCTVEELARDHLYAYTHKNLTADKLHSVWTDALQEPSNASERRPFDKVQRELGKESFDICPAESQVRKQNFNVKKGQSKRLQKFFFKEDEDGNDKEALVGLHQESVWSIKSRRNRLTHSSFIDALRSCAKQKDLQRGRELHAYLDYTGLLKRSISISTALVNMYSKCSALGKAEDFFDGICDRNVVSWNALVDGYIQLGHMQSALAAFHQMPQECIFPSSVTYVYVFKACASLCDTNSGKAAHAQLASNKSLEIDSVLCTALITMYIKCKLPRDAEEIFGQLKFQDVVAWNALISGYSHLEDYDKAIECFQQMQSNGLSPNAVTFMGTLKACGSSRAVVKGQAVHACILKEGLLAKEHVGNVLLAMYVKCGNLERALEVFDGLVVKDVVSWSTLITGYSYFWPQKALCCFDQMQQDGHSPNAITFCCTLRACSKIGVLNRGQAVHAMILKEGCMSGDIALSTALVDMCVKCGMLFKAQQVFDELSIQSVSAWTALISGYAQAGKGNVALELFHNMTRECKSPNLVTYVTLLSSCCNTGLLDEGQLCFEMLKEHGMFPTFHHFVRIVDLYARAGQLEKAAILILKMPFSDNLIIWRSFLGACQKWASVKFGRWAFHHALQWNPLDAIAYVMMGNISQVNRHFVRLQ